MKSKTIRRLSLAAAIVAELSGVSAAWAQTANPAAASGGLLEEVTVTAQRREQSMQDVSLAVTALTGDMLENLGFQNLTQVFTQIPNVNFGEGYQPLIIMRGQSNLTGDTGSAESPVGVYVDELYRAQLSGRWAQLFDLERVEVLRGPQGTLFGRNTTAGVVQYVSAKPTREFEAYVNLEYGSYDTRIIDGAISGPISDRVRGRVAFKYHKDDGWMTNTNPDPALNGDKFGVTDAIAVRGLLDIDVTDDLLLSLNLAHTRQRNTTKLFTFRGLVDPTTGAPCEPKPVLEGRCASFLGFVNQYPENPEKGLTELTPDQLPENLDITTAIAKFTWKVNDDMTLVSLSGYETLDRLYRTDDDVGSDGLFGLLQFHSLSQAESKAFTQELRVEGKTDSTNWVSGAYYYHDKVSPFLIAYPDLGEPPGTIDTISKTGVESWALFGQFDTAISDTVRFIVGARYTSDKRTADVDTGGSASGGARVQGEFDIDAKKVTGKIGLEWRPTDGVLAYASASTGFKSGQFNVTFLQGDLSRVTPTDVEKDTAYEIGLKWEFWGGRARWNSALWYTDVSDLQGSFFETNPQTFVPESRFSNFGDAEIYGLESELVIQPVDRLEVSLGVGLTESKIKAPLSIVDDYGGANFDPATGGALLRPLNGYGLPNHPKVSLNGLVRYRIPAAQWGDFTLQADGNWKGKSYNSPVEDPYSKNRASGALNTRLMWDSSDGRFHAEGYVLNLTNEKRDIDSYPQSGLDWAETVLDKPRTWGVRVGIRFQ